MRIAFSKKKLVVYFDSILVFLRGIKFKSKVREFTMQEIPCKRKIAKKCDPRKERENSNRRSKMGEDACVVPFRGQNQRPGTCYNVSN